MSRGSRKVETLTAALARLLEKVLLPDLQARAKTPSVAQALQRRWEHERSLKRTAEKLDGWVEQALEQIGAAWILSCVFVRTLEDRGLVERRRLVGEGAADSEQYFFELAPELGVRDYLLSVFHELGELPGAEELLSPAKNPAWRLSPSEEGARNLLEFFREVGEGGVGLRWSFDGEDTRFLGDLYQDLSAAVRERYALLQTPDFVEKFILSLTLDPALKEFGLEGLRLLDPTCGSGHFLLGAYDRLFEERCAAAPGGERRVHAQAALAQVHGVDINPYAVAIARFRLTLAYMTKAGVRLLREVPRLPLSLVVADSLLHGARGQRRLAEVAEDRGGWGDELFTLDDEVTAKKVLEQGYHVVVGNPPYITCRDAALRELYRGLYGSCYREFALAAPFTERFFQLGAGDAYVGLINANSFMKRQFGKALVESVLPAFELTHVIDTSGALIPGHGTPTVILLGRSRTPASEKVRTVLGRRGEPATPGRAEDGLVWKSATLHLAEVGYEDEFVSVVDFDRIRLSKHPWSLGGGGAAELKARLEEEWTERLGAIVASIGYGCITKQDEVFAQPAGVLGRARVEPKYCRRFVLGEQVRDWSIAGDTEVLFPYEDDISTAHPESLVMALKFMWPWREVLLDRRVFGGETYREAGKPWYEYGQIPVDRYKGPLAIAFAFVATHNHFALDRDGKVFKQTAPIIKLPTDATEADYLALLGYLNSSMACFWIKQVAQPKTVVAGDKILQPDLSKIAIEITGTHLLDLPVPGCVFSDRRLGRVAAELDRLATARARLASDVVREAHASEGASEWRQLLSRRDSALLERMVALQEVLDAILYAGSGLLEGESAALLSEACDIAIAGNVGIPMGQRAFESRGNPSDPLSRALRDATCRSPALQLIETPNYKRRWLGTQGRFQAEGSDAESRVQDRVKAWLLTAAEDQLKPRSAPVPVRVLAADIWRDVGARKMAELVQVMDSQSLAEWLVGAAEAVPFAAALSFTDEGMAKRLSWEACWESQRREDSQPTMAPIPAPPKYKDGDFRHPSYFRLRGKLDVPKERFISYPGVERDGEGHLIGWAGWDHLQRAQALAALYTERRHTEGWPKEKLTPLLAGLLELVPWLKQWHDEPSPEHDGARLGTYFECFVQTETRELGLTIDDLRNWRPPAPTRGRRARRPAATEEP